MKLHVLPDGRNNSKGIVIHLSVYLYLMESPYDDMLSWPLKGKCIKVTLLNQFSNINHHSVSHNIVGVYQIMGLVIMLQKYGIIHVLSKLLLC